MPINSERSISAINPRNLTCNGRVRQCRNGNSDCHETRTGEKLDSGFVCHRATWPELSEAAFRCRDLPASGDGHIEPHNWVCGPVGPLFKMNAMNHAFDHTFIEQQSMLWDVDSVLVEWKPSQKCAMGFLEALQNANMAELKALRFFQKAYVAFRLGQETFTLPAVACRSRAD
jgi:hypothetical protein